MRVLQSQIQIPKYASLEEFRNPLKSEPEEIKEYLAKILPSLSKAKMEEITKLVRQYYTQRYKHLKTPKYGTLNKGFTEQQIQRFFRVINDDKFRILFSYQANLGLRIGEVIKLNINDLDLDSRELKLKSEKSGRLDVLIIPLPLFKETLAYIRAYKLEIERAKGFLFFRSTNTTQREEPYLEPNYVRKRFREYIKLANLDNVYDISEESSPDRRVRQLHILTSHSLRHFAITRFSKQTNGNLILTSRFARHSDPSTTMIYINTDKRELYEAIDSIALADVQELKRRVRL